MTLDGASESLADFAATYEQDYVKFEFTLEVAGTVDSSGLGGTATFRTDAPLVGRLGRYPEGGALTFSGSTGAMRLEEGSGGEVSPGEVGLNGNFYGDGFAGGGGTLGWFNVFSVESFAPWREDIEVPSNLPDFNAVTGRIVAVASDQESIHDVAVDRVRGQLYASIPWRNEVAVLSTTTYGVTKRIPVGSHPKGLDLGDDGENLFVALQRGGAVAKVNLDTDIVSRIETALANDSSGVENVEEHNARLYASAASFGLNTPRDAYIATTDFAQPTSITRLNSSLTLRDPAPLSSSPDGRYLYTSHRAGNFLRLYKIDLAVAGAPVVLTRDLESQSTVRRLTLSPDGSRLVLPDGRIFSTADFSSQGEVFGSAALAFSSHGQTLVTLRAGRLLVYDANTLVIQRSFSTDCPATGLDSDFIYIEAPAHWLISSDNRVCGINLDQQNSPPGLSGGTPVPAAPQTVPLTVTQVPLFTSLAQNGNAIRVAEMDRPASRIYVAGTQAGQEELAVLNLSDLSRIATVPFNANVQPISLSLNEARTRLFINQTFGGPAQIEVLDTASLTYLSPLVYPSNLFSDGATSMSDARWIGNGQLMLTPMGAAQQPAQMATMQVANAATSLVAQGQYVIAANAGLLTAPDHSKSFVMYGYPRLTRVELGGPSVQVGSDRQSDELYGSYRGAFSADGAILYVQGGVAVSADTLMLVGAQGEGYPVLSADGSRLYVLTDDFPRLLRVVNTTTFQTEAQYSIQGCGQNSIAWAARGAAPGEVLWIQDTNICRVMLP